MKYQLIDQFIYIVEVFQRSYNACLALQHLGFDNIYNVSGGFMGISFYEYYNDKVQDREPIVTEYNFN